MKLLRRILIAVVGGSVVLFGIALIFLPGPGLLTIVGGLAILAIEFAWARHWLVKVKSYMPGKKVAAVKQTELVQEKAKTPRD